MSADADLALDNLLKTHGGRLILAEFMKTMYFLASIETEDKEKGIRLVHAQEGGFLWFERLYMVSKANTLKMISDHFMEGGT